MGMVYNNDETYWWPIAICDPSHFICNYELTDASGINFSKSDSYKFKGYKSNFKFSQVTNEKKYLFMLRLFLKLFLAKFKSQLKTYTVQSEAVETYLLNIPKTRNLFCNMNGLNSLIFWQHQTSTRPRSCGAMTNLLGWIDLNHAM